MRVTDTVRETTADVSSASPSSEQMRGSRRSVHLRDCLGEEISLKLSCLCENDQVG